MTFRPSVPFSRRKVAAQAGANALENLKRAALRYGLESVGGSHPLDAGARLRIAAKAYHAAETEYADAVVEETQEVRHDEVD